ncbi:M20 family metallo-hydrolase [Senegalia massiliensis]|uniref:Zn-dependent hydrolase n=1 Tax=Senegalia massiliensis TaxID=1720316 RepID=A0A845R1N6_9CLOT|nr:M20 family metallo-hydrolase [Senegalia massiliensis]NBI07332.1 Zn-dependent hydrolase [Senegalia massiliensis]
MRINLGRVVNDIEQLARFNETPGNGVTRLSFTKEDKEAREYIKKEMKKIGLEIYEDGYSNLFGRREGKNSNALVIMFGSHYDSVINGGKLDGVLGVVAAIEIMRVLDENNIENFYPIEMVAMNDEEGVRFGTGVSNSRSMAGLIKEEELDRAKDKKGVSLREAMIEFGLTPNLEDAKRDENSIKAFIELHIEQGPVLQNNNKDIGLVETIVGLDRYDIKFKGKAGHAGTTPMDNRKDALVAASKFIISIEKIAKNIGEGTVATVGELKLSPNASNVIPGFVEISVDIRSTKEQNINSVYNSFKNEIEKIKKELDVDIEVIKTLYTPPVDLSEENIKLMENISEKLGYKYLKMNSGAGHDAMNMAHITPTSLIFVPSENGLSHHPDEFTKPKDFEKGIELMLNTIVELAMRYDNE